MVTTGIRSPFIPLLENGDRLTQQEFERRYDAMPHGTKAQLIEGMVYMSAALRYRHHGRPHSRMNTWLGHYQAFTSGVEIADAPTVRMDQDNEPQPDIALFLHPEFGGQVTLSEDDYLEGAPELLVEISASTVSIDLGAKKTAYERNGVKEYIVWRVLDEAIDWFYLSDEKYVQLTPNENGLYKSLIFPGLWLDPAAILAGDMPQVLRTLQLGMETVGR